MSAIRRTFGRWVAVLAATMLPCLAQDPKVWQVGVENTPPSSDEFGVHTGANEAPPGALGVMDDDFYTQGTYPTGFNGLTAQRVLASDEAATQWERSLTPGDRTNRLHFVLSSAQVSAGSRGRLSVGLFNGNVTSNSVNLGFGQHFIVMNFRNAAGGVTQLSSNVVTAETQLVTSFSIPFVAATAGANTVEIVRTGPTYTGASAYIRFDHVTLEVDAAGNTPPVPVAVSPQSADETVPYNLTLQTTDTDTPANEIVYTPLSVPSGLVVQSTGNVIWTPTESQGGASYTVTYRVTDDGIPKLMATNSFTIAVNEVNRPPTTTTISTQTINEGSAFSINVVASDLDLPAQTLSYAPVAATPAGVSVSSSGLVTWTPTEAQGPSTNVVSIRITDSGVPPLSVTNNFTVRVLEVGTAPTLTDVPAQSADEGATFTYNLTASDPDLPANTLTFAKVSGPAALTVAANGLVTWNIQEADGPSTSTVIVKVTDNGSPTRSHTNQFSLTANEVNQPPVIPNIATQIVTPAAPLDLQLVATDPDVPSNSLTYERLSGPTGLTISASGLATWTPTQAQIPSTSTVTFRVTDNGSPNRSATNAFTVVTESVQARYVWQIGDAEPDNSTAMDEFSTHNNNTLPPGSVWRRSGDPAFSPSATYVADDDHYMAGVYPQGFNGLTAPLTVTLDEDVRGWERNLTGSDRTNRLHLILTQDQIVGAAAFRVTYEITSGWTNNGGPSLGFGAHPLVVRFRNGNGVTTTLSSRTVTDDETITFVFSATNVQATLGPNTLEWVNNVPQPTGTSSGATFDYVLIEAEASGNPPPVPVGVGTPTIDEMVPYTRTLSATDASVPAQQLTHTVISAPSGLTVSPTGGLSWTPTEAQGPGTHAVSVRVTDSGSPPKSATNNFNIVVREVNRAPVPIPFDPQDPTIPELAIWSVDSTTDDPDIPANQLTYTKLGGPATLTISPAGLITWTPTETHGPGNYLVTILVEDDGNPPLQATNVFLLGVVEANTPPSLVPPALLSVMELAAYSGTLGASDPDLPANSHVFSLLSGPDGLTISPSGAVNWTPSEAQGPANQVVTVVITDIPGVGVTPRSSTNSFTLVVGETNTPPVFGTITDPTLDELTPLNLTLTASDEDLPANSLTFNKVSGPEGLTVLPNGQVQWIPSEAQGPSTNTVEVSVSDGGNPAFSDTASFQIIVLEANAAPTTTPLTPLPVDELVAWTQAVPAADSDQPTNSLALELITHPEGATLSPEGILSWTPPEDAGPGSHEFSVRITDDGDPVRSTTNTFSLQVREVNTSPELVVPPTQVLDGINPLAIQLDANDTDVPANSLTYDLISGPVGLTVSSSGAVDWSPLAAYNNSTNLVTVRVTDSGSPALSDTGSFEVVVASPATRLVWEIGVDDVPPSIPDSEFGLVNDALDTAPGAVTRLEGDPALDPENNPGPDDHYYFSGTYVAGYNGLASNLQVPNDEPFSSWESRLTTADPSNRFHFLVNSAQLALNARLLLTVHLPEGGSNYLGSPVAGFGEHELVLRLINGSGDATVLFSNLITAETNIVLDLDALSTGATLGANAIELVRTGPSAPDTDHWLTLDYLRLESVFDPNTPPLLESLAESAVNELSLLTLNLTALDGETPAPNLLFSLISGPPGVQVSPQGQITWTPAEDQGPSTNLLTVQVSDDGVPPLKATNSYVVVVAEVNAQPVIIPPIPPIIAEGDELSLNLSAEDSDNPANTLTFEKIAGPGDLVVTPGGVVEWNTDESTGPSANLVTVRVSDNGEPALSATHSFLVTVQELNQPPDFPAIPDQEVDEMTLLSLSLEASDPDVPANTVTFSLISGPSGMLVSPAGVLTWTPTETQGPTNVIVRVRATDTGSPNLSRTNQFSVQVNEVNRAPSLTAVGSQTVAGGGTLSLSLSASDPDAPANTLSFSLVSGPAGLTVSSGGAVSWTPGNAQIPSTATVSVRVTDNGVPQAGSTNQFTVNVTGSVPRFVWQLGTDNGSNSEFPSATGGNQVPPGSPTVIDDDYYAAGTYPSGFNSLASALTVGSDETNPGNWEKSLTATDRTNRFHFNLHSTQVTPNSMMRLITDFSNGGRQNGATWLDFGTHDIVIRFRNQSGSSVVMWSGTFTAAASNVVQIPLSTVNASAGANTLEFVRTGPNDAPYSYYLGFDHVRLEVDARGNQPPVFPNLGSLGAQEGTQLSINVGASDDDTPSNQIAHALISGPSGASVSSAGLLTWTPGETFGGTTNIILVRATDVGIPPKSSTNVVTVVVAELNSAPTIAGASTITVDALTPLLLSLSGSDPDIPADALIYDKVEGPASLVVSPEGLVSWVPQPADLPSTNVVRIRVTDDGVPARSATNLFTVIASTVAMAERNSWWIGVDNSPLDPNYSPSGEFGTPNNINDLPPGQVTRLAGDPQYVAPGASRDDDYYTRGIYPAGYNNLGSYLVVPSDEPFNVWEGSLTHLDRTNRFHFRLREEQADGTGLLRLRFEFTSGNTFSNGVAVGGFNNHDIIVRFRNGDGVGTVIYSNRLDQVTAETVVFAASAVNATVGANQIEFIRTGPNLSGHTHSISMDFVNLESDFDALTDADADGLPLAWEGDHHLDDADSSDAAQDLDEDGLTALAEYNGGVNPTNPRRWDSDGDGLSDAQERTLGSNPNAPDTDGDGLTDFAEVQGVPSSSPLVADTDGDGWWDFAERRLGTNPSLGSSTPRQFRGGIGLNFVSISDPDGVVGTNVVAGPVPQRNWNETIAFPTGGRNSGSTADFLSPVPGMLVRSDGTTLPNLKVNWTSEGIIATQNRAVPDGLLMNGMLRASGVISATVTVSNVPFSTYDVYVVVGGATDTHRGRLRLNNSTATDRTYQALSTAPQSEFIDIPAGNPVNRQGNVVRYTGVTGSVFSVNLAITAGYAVGIHAIQIVDTTLDFDVSGIPDWWEAKYGIQPASTALSNTDTDGDGLTNLEEYNRGSNPRLADTDEDGLADGTETAANALKWDSDNDGIADNDELTALLPSNPLLADSDSDGVSDGNERKYLSDPAYREANSATFTGWVPVYRASPAQWEWNLENIQIVWDHGEGDRSNLTFGENLMVNFAVRNSNGVDYRSIQMGLRYYRNAVTPWLLSYPWGAFSASSASTSTLKESPEGFVVRDLTKDLGFSGQGSADISDRLRFRLLATRGTGNSWTLTYEIWNQTRNVRVLLRTYSNSTAAASVDAGTANWMDAQNVIGRALIQTAQGVDVRFSPTPLHNRPQYAAHKDTDNDGMPDPWETANGLNLNLASDGASDRDNDGVSATDEYLLGLNPRNPDSDGDGVPDGTEQYNRSNPADPASRPAYAGFVWPSGEDLNGDGLPDAWQAHYNAYGIGVGSDNDGDGQSNSQEALWGTDPFDAASKITLSLAVVPPDIHLTWPHQPLKQQTLFWTTNVPNWVAYDADPLTDAGISKVILPNRIELAPGELYRVDTYDVDTDGDGVTDWTEGALGMDPFNADSSRQPVRVMTATGVVTGSVSGDYVTFVERMRQAPGVGAQQMTRSQAARFLRQATFGATSAELDRVQHLGFGPWIDDQIQNKASTLHADYIREILKDFDGPRKDATYSFLEFDNLLRGANVLTSFARAATAGEDQLRQRVAFALSQILVISRRNGDLLHRPLSVANYYDILVRNAFGNYYDILREVTLSPVMGHYLSHVGNQKAILSINQFPDENYAREVKQLFSIGLWELHPDGTRKLNGLGQPIPTYGNEQITEFARVFTGLWFGGQAWGVGGSNDKDLIAPMDMWPDKHDFGSKTLLNGFVIPARTPSRDNGIRDVEDALRNLVDHPNTPPFIGRQLIQFLVTSNPSSNYVSRISAVFANDGAGHRGNLGAVVRAILLDPEARDPRWSTLSTQYGRLREPVERTIALARLGSLGRHPGLLWWSFDDFAEATLQEPSFAPTVFNFFRPDYQPPGLMAAAGLVGPVFQITDTFSSIALPNKLWEIIEYGFVLSGTYAFPPDYGPLLALADQPELLLDEINLILCGGEMTVPTRQTILSAMDQIGSTDALTRVLIAVYVAATCPEGAVQH